MLVTLKRNGEEVDSVEAPNIGLAIEYFYSFNKLTIHVYNVLRKWHKVQSIFKIQSSTYEISVSPSVELIKTNRGTL